MTCSTLRALALGTLLATAGCQTSRLETDVSLAELQAVALADANDAVAHYNLALGYWSQSNFLDARESLLDAVRTDPRFAEAYFALAFLPYAQRPQLWQEIYEGTVPEEWSDAVIEADQNYNRALMINPLVDMRILGAVTQPPGWWEATGLSNIYATYFAGFDDYRNGNYEAAYGRYDRLIRNLEDSWRRDARQRMPDAILLHRGLAAAHLGIWDVAVGDIRIIYDRWLSAEEDEDDLIHVPLETNHYRYLLAAMLEGAGQTTEAEALLRTAVTEDLGLYMAHVRLANVAEARGDARTAVQERQLAINANPEDATLHLDLGLTYANVRMYPQSIAALETARQLNPRDPQAVYFLGVVHALAGDNAAARSAFEEFLADAPARMAQERSDAEARLAAMR